MKNICLTITIAVFLLICLNELQAQTTETKLNQVELMKQFIGSWKSELDKDTTEFLDVKPYGTGLEMNDKYVTKKKIVMEEKELSGYDKKADKYISCELTKSGDIVLSTAWFISKSKFICISYSDISNPENATIRFEGEFKSPDTWVETYLVNNKPIVTDTYTRVK